MSSSVIFVMLCNSEGIPVPDTEYKFHEKRKWRFDYAWPDYKVALEVEGGVWNSTRGGKSRHFHGKGIIGDMEKYNNAAMLGWRLIRIPPVELLKVNTIEIIRKCLTKSNI